MIDRARTVLLGIVLCAVFPAAGSAIPPRVDYRLYLGRDAGPEKGPVPITFTAYADSLGGAPLWSERHTPVADANGQVRLSLGSVTPFPPAILDRSVFWVEIRILDRVLPKRRKIESITLPFGDTGADSARWNPLPPKTLPDGRIRLATLDFGPLSQEAPHRTAMGADDRLPALGWSGGSVRDRSRPIAAAGPYYCDYVEGHDAVFTAAVDPPASSCRIILMMGDIAADRGPVDVLVGERIVAAGVLTKGGEIKAVTFDAKAERGRVSFRLRSRSCEPWAIVGLDLYGAPGARLTSLFADVRPADPVPPPEGLAVRGQAVPAEVLGTYCRFLMAERLTDGTFSSTGAWYANAYPIRTLLAGARLLGEPTWRDAALECLDRFVAEQRPDGGWYSSYFGPDGCRRSGEPDTLSANLADVGTMSLCLAVAAAQADEPRRKRYLDAAVRYAERVVLPSQLPGGAFPNGLYKGAHHGHPYSVATATQAASLAALGAATGNRRYGEAADRAGLWLAAQFRADGSVIFAPHDTDQPRVLPPTAFGDVFYLVEALTWVERYATRSDTRTAARLAVDRFLWGPQGLKSQTRNGYWWRPQNPWVDAKMGGMLYVLSEAGRWSRPGALDAWIRDGLAWLADPSLSRQIGVLAPAASRTGLYGTTATGMAGLGMANLVDSAALHPTGRVGSGGGPSTRPWKQ